MAKKRKKTSQRRTTGSRRPAPRRSSKPTGFIDELLEAAGEIVQSAVEFVDKNKAGIAVGVGLSLLGYKGVQALRPKRKKILEQIVENVLIEKQNPTVMMWVQEQIVRGEHNKSKQVALVMKWMDENLKWQPDSTEDRAYPFFTILERRGGDCDDYASFFCTCIEAVGIHTSLLIFEGREVNGVAQQGHAVPLVRAARDVPENAQLATNPRMIRAQEGAEWFYWLVCDPQTGAPGILGERWRQRLIDGDYYVVHNKR